jgi:hypothetical protein
MVLWLCVRMGAAMSWLGKKKQPEEPNFSQVISREEALRLTQKGLLVPLLLLPEMFGGDADPRNVVYVPRFVAELKRQADEDIVRPLAAAGKITRYNAQPNYAGRSLIPVSLTIHAHEPGDFTPTIGIWGEGLTA